MKYNSILETIGNTPMINISSFFLEAKKKKITIYLKLEKNNPAGSIKDRIALAMINDAEKKGILKHGSVIIEPTSGNTGVGLAMVCAVKGYPLIITMPESMSIERRKLMSAFGAKLELTPKENGMKGAIEKARELLSKNPNTWMPMQFENLSNVAIHQKTTAQEIFNDLSTDLDYIVAGVGTGGHITGCMNLLKEKIPHLKFVAVEPTDSAVLSGGKPGSHAIQGIGAGFVPSILNTNGIDQIFTITKEEAFSCAQKLAKECGILVGVSTGANLASVIKLIPTVKENATIVTFNYDTGERYLSVDGLY